ncbi:MAG: hypothetical protein ACYC5H_12820 [Methylovirgula sp.]
MTRVFASSSSRFALALSLALAMAGGLTGFVSPASAASASGVSNGVRCFFGANSDAKHGSTSGWVCAREQNSAR